MSFLKQKLYVFSDMTTSFSKHLTHYLSSKLNIIEI